MRKYWIKFYVDECAACGKSDVSRERQYDTPKPEDSNKRYEYHQYMCWSCAGGY